MVLIGLSACCLIFKTSCAAGDGLHSGLDVGAERFIWQEYDRQGKRLLKESGPRATVAGTVDTLTQPDRNVVYSGQAKVYFGKVYYDGQTQAGVPITSDVYYDGVIAEVLAGYRLSEAPGINLLLGLGADKWSREIKDTQTANGAPVAGYTERYTIFYSKLGIHFFSASGHWRNYFQVGGKYPFYTREKLAASDTGYDNDVTLSPGKRISGFVTWKTEFTRNDQAKVNISLYYDSFRFSDSASEPVTVNGASPRLNGTPYCCIYQPKSNMDVIGVQLGYRF